MNTTQKRTSPKDFFLHLLAIIMLYIAAGSFISLLFSYINIFFADPLEGSYQYFSAARSIRWAVSALVVIFPTYVWASWLLNKGYAKDPEKRDLRIRKWLLYFTLFAAAFIIIGDLVAIIFNFLGGEITLRFLFKVLAILFVTGSIFGYYFFDLRKDKKQILKYFARTVIAIVAVAIIASFFIIGSPAEERMRRFDERRISDLQSIQWEIVNFWQRKERLPETLDELTDDIRGFRAPQDPETKEPYEYQKSENLTFELCATFVLKNEGVGFPEKLVSERGINESWSHGAERTCFERTIDPDFYPPAGGRKPVPVRF